jgi:hypothetical protein
MLEAYEVFMLVVWGLILICVVTWTDIIQVKHRNSFKKSSSLRLSPVKEHFFGENIPANPDLIRSGLSVEHPDDKGGVKYCAHEGVETLFDYSNRFIDEQLEASRIFILPPSQPGEIMCR